MGSFENIINRQLMILVLIALGVVISKIGIISEDMQRKLSNIVITVLLPCNIVSIFMVDNFDPGIIQYFLLAVGISFIIEIVSYFISKPLFAFVKDDRLAVLRYSTVSPNAGFIGIPLVEGIYGAQGLLYLSAYLFPLNIFMWSFGQMFFMKNVSFKDTVKKLVTHPCIIAVAVGFVLMVTDFRPPVFIEDGIRSLGNCVTPLALLITGSILSGVKLKSVVSGVSIYFSILRLIVFPLATLGILLLLNVPTMITAVLVLAVSLPAATGTVMLSTLNGGNSKFASQLIFISTLLSMVTVPLITLLVERVA